MLHRFREFIHEQQLISPTASVLLAVSGGLDSVAMCELFHLAKIPFGIAHCNFGLRGKESEGDELFVKQLAKKYKVAFFSARFATKELAHKKGISIQMAARELRYAWFEKVRKENKYSTVATAHHRDDVAETFLINLLRGSGIAGLHGIPLKQGNIIRPLLFSERKSIQAFVKKAKLKHREDSSNQKDDYQRNRLRHHVLPLLEEMRPGIADVLFETTVRIGDAEEIYRKEIERVMKTLVQKKGKERFISISLLKKVSPLETYLFEVLQPYGFGRDQLGFILNILDAEPGKYIQSDSYRLWKDRDRLIIAPKQKKEEGPVMISHRETNISEPIHLVISRKNLPKKFSIPTSKSIAWLDEAKLQFPLTLRKWKQGDRFYPLGMNKAKKLSDFFIDNKVPVPEKENTWILISGKDICWVVGHRIDNRYRIEEKTAAARIFIAAL
jgi:tRNA(Ile)-lysidine synthase